jgi:hypothetical protein
MAAGKKKKPKCLAAQHGADVFANTVKRLIASEARASGLTPNESYSTRENNRSDGGIDAIVHRGSQNSRWLSKPTIFQFKLSKPKPSEIMAEVEDPKNKELRQCLRKGYVYTLVFGDDASEPERLKLERALQKQWKQLRLLKSTLQVWNGSKLDEWLSEHLSVGARLPGFPAELMTWDHWGADTSLRMERDRFPWTPDQPRTDAIVAVRNLFGTGGAIRIEGPAGVGKSRVVFEAVSEIASETLYCPGFDEDLIRFLRESTRLCGCLVVDECSANDFAKLVRSRPESLTLVSIGVADFSGSRPAPDVLRLQPLEQEPFLQLAMNTESPLPEGVRQELARRSGRYTKLFRLAVDAYERYDGPAGDDDQLQSLLKRFVAGDEEQQTRAIEVLSLPTRYSVDDFMALGKAFDISKPDLVHGQAALKKRALLGGFVARDLQRTGFQYVTPRLFAEWMSRTLWDEPLVVIEGLKGASAADNLVLRVFDQLLQAEHAAATLRKLMSHAEVVVSLLSNELLERLLEVMAVTVPEQAQDFARRLLPHLDQADRTRFIDPLKTSGWQAGTFKSACDLVLAFGASPSAVAPFFGTVLGITQAPGDSRIEVLQHWSSRPELAAFALAGAGEASQSEAGRSHPSGSIDLRLAWRPPTVQEEERYRSQAIAVLASFLDHPELAREARYLALRSFSGLLREGLVPNAMEVGRALVKAGLRHEVREESRRFLRFEGARPVQRQAVEVFIRELGPLSLLERVREIAERLEPVGDEEAAELANELLGSLDPSHFQPLMALGATTAYSIGRFLGDKDAARVALPLLLKLVTAPGSGNRLVCGYVERLADADDLLDQWSQDAELVPLVFDASRIVGSPARGFARLRRLFETKRVPVSRAADLYFGGFLRKVKAEEVAGFLRGLLAEVPHIVLALGFQIVSKQVEPLLESVLVDAYAATDPGVLDSHSRWSWEQCTLRLEDKHLELVADRCLAAVMSDEALSFREAFARLGPRTRQAIVEGLSNARRFPLQGLVPLDDLSDWATGWAHKDRARQDFLARWAGDARPGTLLDRLAEAFPRNENIATEIAVRLRSGFGWGGEAQVLGSYAARASALAERGTKPAAKVARVVLASLEKEVSEASAREHYEAEVPMLAERTNRAWR